MTERFEPRVVGFLCNWCSYEGADAAGRGHIPCPSNFTPIRVMCSGRVDPQFVLDAFANGADGVLILACHPGDCHYKDGNHSAMRRSVLLRMVLEQFGIEKERIRLDWVSASEGERYTRIVTEMVEDVRALGPRAGHEVGVTVTDTGTVDRPREWGAESDECDVGAVEPLLSDTVVQDDREAVTDRSGTLGAAGTR